MLSLARERQKGETAVAQAKESQGLFYLSSTKVGTIDGDEFDIIVLTDKTLSSSFVAASHLRIPNGETGADAQNERAKGGQRLIVQGPRRYALSIDMRSALH